MGNSLCKPVPEQLIEQQPKNIAPLLTEEAIKMLNVENDRKVLSAATVTSAAKEAATVLSETKEETTVTSAAKEETKVLSEAKEAATVLSETKEETTVLSAATVTSEIVEPILEPEIEQLSLIQPPDESRSTSFNEEVPDPPKKKRGRKKKCEQ